MISVVVPIYNEETLIVQFHVAVSIALKGTHMPWEVVYVNDGSKDCSLDLLRALQDGDPHVVVVDLPATGATWVRSRRESRRRAATR